MHVQRFAMTELLTEPMCGIQKGCRFARHSNGTWRSEGGCCAQFKDRDMCVVQHTCPTVLSGWFAGCLLVVYHALVGVDVGALLFLRSEGCRQLCLTKGWLVVLCGWHCSSGGVAGVLAYDLCSQQLNTASSTVCCTYYYLCVSGFGRTCVAWVAWVV